MNPEITKIIDQYLQRELSETDRAAFEKKLSESEVLRKEFELQKTIYEAAERAATRTQVKQTSKSYHFTKKLQYTGIALSILATIATLTFFIAKYASEKQSVLSELSEELVSLIEKLEKESPIEGLKSEFFTWNGSDSVVLSDQGVLLSIPEKAFLLNGKPYSDQALIQWQEALDGATIVKSGLSTMSGDNLLETQGMFTIQAFTPKGEKLEINPKTGIYVQVPVDEYKTGMQLFEGKKNAAGIVDWQNPKPLQKIPVPVDMSKLDFYPSGYEKELDLLKLRKDKKFRDSLYLSFELKSIPIVVSELDYTVTIPKTDSIWDDQTTYDNQDEDVNTFDHISPAKVLSFWNPKFNNTNLATHEFEKRMRSIHGTCNNKILETYTQNLDKSISEIDARIAKMGYPEFEAFAAEQLGAVNPNNPHLKNLMKFYEKSIKNLQDEVKNNRDVLMRKQQKWDIEIADERTKESSRTNERKMTALNEEFIFNLKNVYKQLGIVYRQFQSSVGFTVTGTNPIYNIDRYVIDATMARKSATITDPQTGRKAQITYNDFSFEIEYADQYQQIYAYLFPSMLNSYQRISGENGKFSYPLNGDMMYDVAIVAISEKGYAFFQKKTINAGKLGKISLENISETKLNASIEQLNAGRLLKPMQIKDELNWLVKEQKNYVEQKLRQEQIVFRNRIEKIIFPCKKENITRSWSVEDIEL